MPTVGLKDQMGIGFEGGQSAAAKEGTEQAKSASAAIVYGTPSSGPVVSMPKTAQVKMDAIDAKNFTSMENDLYKAIHENPELKEFNESIIIEQTPEGLRIQLLEKEKRPLFVPGTDNLQPYTKKALAIIAKFIRYMPNYISIDGHTASDINNKDYDNWKLSADRANATRKFLEESNSLDREQIIRIIGKADREPIDPKNPTALRNIRIAMVLLKNSLLPYQKQAATSDALFTDEGGK
jgi:chemotaxis protein MotB